MRLRWWQGSVVVVAAAAVALAACGDGTWQPSGEAGVRLAPERALPARIRRAPATVALAYRFAVANPELLSQIPCHCGCGAMGHTSNAACYLAPGSRGGGEDGAPRFDDHALGCSICVDITQDVIRLVRDGRRVPEIRAYVEATYGRYGPSNLP